ncbi:hypothetical protein BDR26DRAFT_906817 [Obelidium mucronatum]|nr:hypothetical protein BDR26DRAFT_906817 [Obelidium mucronatum]
MKRKEEKEDGKEDILSTSSKHKSRKVAVSNAKRRVPSDVIQQVKDDADFEKLLKETSDDKNCVSIVFVYATWSTPCKQILPIYQALIKKLHTESVSSLKSDLKTAESKDESESATIQDQRQ